MKKLITLPKSLNGLALAGILLFVLSFPWLIQPRDITTSISRPNPQPSSQDMVKLTEMIPGIKVDLRYAGQNNICREKIYDSDMAYLRRGTAEKLRSAQGDFSKLGYTILLWDAYRPPEAQFKLWNSKPDPRFLINPHKATSWHSRGVAVDVTLLNKEGHELLMPSAFDEFNSLADRDYSDVNAQASANAELLERIMRQHGFLSIYNEWWHFVDADRDQYDVFAASDLPK